MFPTFNLSKHALLRMAQRNVSPGDLEYVLEHGERIYRTGITFYMLRKRDILKSDHRKSEITRLEGMVILTGFSQDGILEIITVYRNRSAFKELRSKAKYDIRKRIKAPRNLSIGK